MVPEPVINVEVTVSDELRHLLACGAGCKRVPVHALDPDVIPSQLEPDALLAMEWPHLVLRRDGQRPLVFRGLPFMTRRCTLDAAPWSGEHSLTFYLAEDKTLYASLTFEPPQTASARPTYHCQSILDQSDFARFVRQWFSEMSVGAGVAPDSHYHLAAEEIAVRSEFNFFAADCLCKGVLQV